MSLNINTDFKIIWDNNILLDLFLLRTKDNPYIIYIENFFVKNKVPIYISSSQLPNVKYVLNGHLKRNGINVNPNKILQKFVETHNVRILKTPSYIDMDLWYSNEDVEDELIKLSAETFDAYVMTRDSNFLKKLGERGISPEKFINIISTKRKDKITMLDLTSETLYQYPKIEKNIDKVIKKSNFIFGEEIKQLEEKIANFIGTKHAIGVSSGTEALILSFRALALKLKKQEYWSKEDLIITTPFTFTATGDTILRSGATPLFIDIDLDTYTIDTQLIKKAIEKYGSRVKGIVPVHLYGHPCNMDDIMEIAKEYNIFVVEDCAQSFGAKWNDKMTGSFGETGAFSFFPSKNLGGFGDGGMITTNDDEIAEYVRMLIKHGGKDKYNVDHIGYNARLDTIQAAVLLAKMEYIQEFTEKRRSIAQVYTENLRDVSWLKLPYENPKAYHVYHQYTVRLLEKDRNQIQKALKEEGVDSMVYYPVPLYKMKVFINNGMEVFGSLKNSELAAKNVLSLPIEPLMEEKEIKRVCEIIKKAKD